MNSDNLRDTISSDEMGMMPIVFKKSGCEFKWQILKIAAQIGKPYSISSLLNDSQKLIDWVNDEQQKDFTTNSIDKIDNK